MRPLALLLALATLPGCAMLEGEGEEVLVVSNQDPQPLRVIFIIEQVEGGFRVFGEDLSLEGHGSRTFDVTMRPGAHRAHITTSTGADEVLAFEIPEKGDTQIELSVHRRGATLRLTH